MSVAYFIADVHLGLDDLEKRNLFLSFVKMIKEERGDLYILGDLFDYWANNRRIMRDNRDVLESLASLARSGSRVSFLFGNRDLLLGKKVLSRYGIDFLGEHVVLTIQGKRILLTHGHLLCTNDVNFQNYRRTKWPVYRMLDVVLPGFVENALAKRFMLKSKQVIEAQESWRFKVPEEVIKETFEGGVEMIISGHSHKSGIREFDEHHFFIVLPEWIPQKGGYLYLENGEFQMRDFLPWKM